MINQSNFSKKEVKYYMSRTARNLVLAPYYHVMVQGINKEFIFKEDVFKWSYLKYLKEYAEECEITIIAYCIMGNHAHILLKPNNVKVLYKFMHKLNTKFATIYNKKTNRVGYVFRDRYKAEPIFEYYYLHNCIKYIHMNPVKAGICKKQIEYNFSSYSMYYDKSFFENNNNLFDEIFPTEDLFNALINDVMQFDNSFIEEKMSTEDTRIWIKLFEENHMFDLQNTDKFKKELILGLNRECKLNCSEISKIIDISKYTIRKILKANEKQIST